jgi:Xylanase inhibitor N-terminal
LLSTVVIQLLGFVLFVRSIHSSSDSDNNSNNYINNNHIATATNRIEVKTDKDDISTRMLTSTTTRSTNITGSSTSSATRKVLTIPLQPHSILLERRRRQLSSSSSLESPMTQTTKIERPLHSKYHYQRILQQPTRYTRRQVHEATTALQVVGLFQGYGTHYVDLWCGTPIPQRQTVIVDTGSSNTAFPCRECQNCGVPQYHINPLYNETMSTSFMTLSCDDCVSGECDGSSDTCMFGRSYQEGSSWYAEEVSDLCFVGEYTTTIIATSTNNDTNQKKNLTYPLLVEAQQFAFTMKFGCQTSITGLFITQLEDGIMGMDMAPSAFWYQMYNADKIQHKVFSLCLSRNLETKTEAGAMSLGGTDVRLHITPLVYTTSPTSGSDLYAVQVRKLYLRAGGGGRSSHSTDPNLQVIQLKLNETDLNDGLVIVDSGTTVRI